MTTMEKFKKLVELLYQRTSERKIAWNYEDDVGVWARVGERVIRLSAATNNDLEPIENVTICNANWDTVDSFDDEIFENTKPEVEGFPSYWRLMSRTRNMAHRQAIGADEAIDDILSALDDDVPF